MTASPGLPADSPGVRAWAACCFDRPAQREKLEYWYYEQNASAVCQGAGEYLEILLLPLLLPSIPGRRQHYPLIRFGNETAFWSTFFKNSPAFFSIFSEYGSFFYEV